VTHITASDSAMPRFDGAAAWATLSPEQQAEIGSIALEYVLALNGVGGLFDPLTLTVRDRAFIAADALLIGLLGEAVEKAFPEIVQPLGEWPVPLPFPSRLGAICRECGCSQDDGCRGGCAWVESDLCSACVGRSS
jgi:hypothetical protein